MVQKGGLSEDHALRPDARLGPSLGSLIYMRQIEQKEGERTGLGTENLPGCRWP